MIVLAGGIPVTTSDPAVFSIPVEALVAADPEVIVVGDANYGVCPADVMARPGWSGITAGRTSGPERGGRCSRLPGAASC